MGDTRRISSPFGQEIRNLRIGEEEALQEA
jgi:hypothetical protein